MQIVLKRDFAFADSPKSHSPRYYYLYTVYTNAQRQGAALNMTVKEAKEAKEYTRGQGILPNDISKTTAQCGSVKLVVPTWVVSVSDEVCQKISA